ncbi:major facilitator superfamily domain-containing protein [Daldinia caldariorum]|uniref:major facilitator superfamily domain-containing protein n=1 Tax=Daldinia caldariorum TaxID=326644 RepID=UPI002008CF52|nr:major facilitator superfamily domain-containing protein [Daldinia caldariorum]KAI1464695.1 major facilitator superfamily domain-containing protein [Daldinia caldariorum]
MYLPAAQVSWISSIQIFLCFLVGMISGRLPDAGYARTLYAVGAIMCVFSMFMTTTYWQILLAQGLCQGIEANLMYMSATTNIARFFEKKRSLVVALTDCGSSSGAILYPAIVKFPTPKVGFPWAVRLCGFISIVLAIVGFHLLMPRGLRKTPAPILDLEAFIADLINSFARESFEIGDLKSINFVLISNAVAIPARPFPGWAADHPIGPVVTYGLNCFALGITAFGWIGVRHKPDIYAYSALTGLVNGAVQGIFMNAASSFVQDVRKMGTWIGMKFGICGFATLAGPPTTGAIAEAITYMHRFGRDQQSLLGVP